MPTIQSVVSTVFDVIGTVVGVAVDIFNNTLLPAFTSIFDWEVQAKADDTEIMRNVFENMRIAWEETLRPVF